MDEIDPPTLEEIRNIQMLLGRNILVFQNVEHILKNIHYFRQGAGTPSNLVKRKIKIDELSLGRLSDITALSRIDSKLNSKNDSDFYFEYDILKDDPALNSAIQFFNDINDDRNLLVHNFTVKWPLDKSENRRQATDWLLKQYEAIFAQREVLLTSLNIIIERTNAMFDYFNSEKGINAWEDFIASDDPTMKFTFTLQ